MVRALSFQLLVSGSLVIPVFAQPREFRDDFLTMATYDSDSLLGGCPGYSGSLTKYTLIEWSDRDVSQSRAISGNGRLVLSDRKQANSQALPRRVLAIIGAADVPGCGMTGAPEYAFTDNDICMYGGVMFDAFDLRAGFQPDGYGADGKAGVANVDDDCDGLTDEPDESPVHAGGDTYGPPYSDGGSASCSHAPSDGLPGIGGVDDDGNGIIDDYGELGMGNDSDDNGGRQAWFAAMKVDLTASSLVAFTIEPGADADCLSLREMIGSQESWFESGGFSPAANVKYSYKFCASGTCFGASIWIDTDFVNPVAFVGPVINTHHTATTAVFAGLGLVSREPQYQRAKKLRGNSSFHETFWVCEGNLYPYPSMDLDMDGDVDGFDFLTFANCYNGSNRLPLEACEDLHADFDQDGDVDGFDFLTFGCAYGGSNKKPSSCAFPNPVTQCGS